MSIDSPDAVRWMDDFFGDLIADEWGTTNDTGSVSIVASTGHVLRLNNSNAMNNDYAEVGGELQWRVQDCGTLVMRARCRVNTAVTNVALNVGFNDTQTENTTLPVELSGTTFTTNTSTWAGIVYDTNATTDYFYGGAVDDDNDNALLTTTAGTFGFAPVADRWFTVEVRLADNGSGNMARAEITVIQDVDGTVTNRKTLIVPNAVDRDAYLCPRIGVENRTTTAKVLDVDYVLIEAGRGE